MNRPGEIEPKPAAKIKNALSGRYDLRTIAFCGLSSVALTALSSCDQIFGKFLS